MTEAANTVSSSSSPKPAARPRQHPGAACDECRRRKLRCDRRRPQCGTCADNGVPCHITKVHEPRGPKRGHLMALQNRITELETRLSEQHQYSQAAAADDDAFVCSTTNLDQLMTDGLDADSYFLPTPNTGALHSLSNLATTTIAPHAPSSSSSISAALVDDNFFLPTPPPGNQQSLADVAASLPPAIASSSSTTSSSVSTSLVDDLSQSDLDQTYFDRVHTVVPMLHKQRYFSWARRPNKHEAQACLQYAMWTTAASLSSQFHTMRDSLYKTTRHMLNQLDSRDDRSAADVIEHVQARILLAIYEYMRSSYRNAWMTAGHCFRLVQFMRLYELDAPSLDASAHDTLTPDDWSTVEEKRRTFWMAYLLDRLASISDGWPLTLVESVIMTRLPAPELNFQANRPIVMGFVSDGVAETGAGPNASIPFIELIVLATIGGRIVSHRQSAAVERAYSGSGGGGDVSQNANNGNVWKRHEWLDRLLSIRMQALAREDLPRPAIGMGSHAMAAAEDPILLFAGMLAQTLVLCLCRVVQALPRDAHTAPRIEAYERRSFVAAMQIVSLQGAIAQLSFLKVHPFTPMPLLQCADFLSRAQHQQQQRGDGGRDDHGVAEALKTILDAVRGMRNINNLALSPLEASERLRTR